MSSLKEIKSRIKSVKSTQKITSAMKMVSSVKLRKAESAVNSLLPYQQGLNDILRNYLSNEIEIPSPFSQIRDIKRMAVVVFASNSSLCGSYNANLIKRMHQSIVTHRDVRKEDVMVFPVGKKVYQACKKMELHVAGEFEHFANQPTFEQARELADTLMNLFLKHEIDRVKVIYYKYENKSKQILTADTYLPITLDYIKTGQIQTDYIIEPSREKVITELIPKVLHLAIYAAAIQAHASEYAARTIAMQTATDNADDILQELSLQYNKLRQQAITNELLDIIGGAISN